MSAGIGSRSSIPIADGHRGRLRVGKRSPTLDRIDRPGRDPVKNIETGTSAVANFTVE
jgi:hypothetical protein